MEPILKQTSSLTGKKNVFFFFTYFLKHLKRISKQVLIIVKEIKGTN